MQNSSYDLSDWLVKVEIHRKDSEGKWQKEVWHYEYDALGRRVAKWREGETEAGCLKQENRTDFIWDGSHLLQEVYADGRYTYLYTDQDSYEPLAQIHNWTDKEYASHQSISYFHCDQIGIPREMTDKDGKLLWFGDYSAWGCLKNETNITNAHQPFRLQNQYADRETGLHYNFFRYYEPNCGRFVNQDPIKLAGGDNLYTFAPNSFKWVDLLGLNKCDDKRCAELKRNIAHKSALLIKEFQKYDPVKDGKGGFPMKGGGKTKPGGHYKEMSDLKRGLKNDITEYKKNCVGRDRCDGGGKWQPLSRATDELANRPVPPPVYPKKNSFGDYAVVTGLAVATVGLFLFPFDGPVGEAAAGTALVAKLATM